MVSKICNILRIIIIAIVLSIVAVLLVPRIFGYSTLAVISGSMEPNYPVGSIVITKEVDFDDLEVGDVITYQLTEDTLVTHRIIEIDETNQEVVTKGDANNSEDASPVSSDQIYGKVHADIPYLGYISIYMQTRLGIGIACAIIIALIVLSVIPELLKKEDEELDEIKKEDEESGENIKIDKDDILDDEENKIE